MAAATSHDNSGSTVIWSDRRVNGDEPPIAKCSLCPLFSIEIHDNYQVSILATSPYYARIE